MPSHGSPEPFALRPRASLAHTAYNHASNNANVRSKFSYKRFGVHNKFFLFHFRMEHKTGDRSGFKSLKEIKRQP